MRKTGRKSPTLEPSDLYQLLRGMIKFKGEAGSVSKCIPSHQQLLFGLKATAKVT